MYKTLHKEGGVEKLKPKGLKFTSLWDPSSIADVNFRRFWKNYRRRLTFYFSGQMIPQTKAVPIFSVYHKRKPLPYFEIQLNFKEGEVIIRYQGKKSFQRSYIRYGKALDMLSSFVIHLDKNIVTLRLGCENARSVKLKQHLPRFPTAAKIALQDHRTTEKFVVSIVKIILFRISYISYSELCYQDLKV